MGTADPRVIASVAVIIGIVLAGVILWLTGYFTGTEHKPVKDVGESSLTGAATVILSGISIGFESAVYTALVIAAAVYGAFRWPRARSRWRCSPWRWPAPAC